MLELFDFRPIFGHYQHEAGNIPDSRMFSGLPVSNL